MCGIAGILRPGGRADASTVTAMAARLRHRGPDACGSVAAGEVALAHTRLSIVDPAGGDQPLSSADGRLLLVANGEIYNHVELRAELSARGHRFRTGSDCEAILHAYAEWGVDGIARLRGMFAFALYDRASRRLLLARDRLGIKPLFLLPQGRGGAFASEVKALLPASDRAPCVDAGALVRWLHAGAGDHLGGLIAGIREVLPGTVLIFEGGEPPVERRYWSLRSVPTFEGDLADALTHLDGLFARVMTEHVRADVPFGLLLSGGVDSGTLAGLLSARGGDRLSTFSVGYRGVTRHDELDAADRVSRRFGTQHHRIEIDPATLADEVVDAVWAADGLIRDPAMLPTLVLAREASRHLKVVFTGEGGDEVFAGYGRYRVDSPGRRLGALIDRAGGGMHRRTPWSGVIRRDCLRPQLANLWRDRRRPACRAWAESAREWGHTRRRQYVDLTVSLPNALLIKVDRSLMAYGLEGRVPFLDHRMVEFGLSLPAQLKISGRQRKWVLKRWAERYLPGEHLYAAKRGFHVPTGDIWGRPTLKALTELLPGNRGIREWFRPEGVRTLVRRHAERADRGQALWALAQFAVWHRLFIEGDGDRPVPGTGITEVLEDAVAPAARPVSGLRAAAGTP